jgi:hypothetical protein
MATNALRTFALTLAPQLLQAHSRLLGALGDDERFSGVGSRRRRRWGTDGVNPMTESVVLSAHAVDALGDLVGAFADIRPWLVSLTTSAAK